MPGSMLASADVNADNRIWLGTIGHVAALNHSDTLPGGPSTLTCTVQASPGVRHAAFEPGRRVTEWRGATLAWEGTMEEPEPGDDGWHLTASGAGTWGERYRAVYTGLANWTAAGIIGAAITRGLPWQAGTLTGAFLTDVRDSASMSITEFLDLITSPAGRAWRVRRNFPAPLGNTNWLVDLLNVPSTATRLLIANGPVQRTLAAYVNTLYTRYQVTADKGNTPATFAERVVTGAGVAKHGTYEASWDLSGAGVLSAATVDGLAASALAKYTAASWSGPFTVGYGQYLTMGGAPVDLGCETAGEVARLIISTGPYGGEILPAPPIEFPVGKVEYNDDEELLTITPLQSWRGDLNNVLQLLAPKAPR